MSRLSIRDPRRLAKWLVFGVAAAIALYVAVAAAILAGTFIHYELTRTTTGDVTEMIEEKLPLGSSAEEIAAFLDSRQIDHGAVERSGEHDPELKEAGIPPGTMIIHAVVRNSGQSIVLRDVGVYFILDEQARVRDSLVYEITTGP